RAGALAPPTARDRSGRAGGVADPPPVEDRIAARGGQPPLRRRRLDVEQLGERLDVGPALLEQPLEPRDDRPIALLTARPEQAGRDAGALLGVALLDARLELGGHAPVGLVVDPLEVGPPAPPS